MIAHGVTLPAGVEIMKAAMVETATRDFSIDEGPPTDSRVNLLTGVHRKDVKRLRADQPTAPKRSFDSLCAAVIGQWLGDPDFLTEAGEPNDLARGEAGEAGAFDTLVKRVSVDVPVATVLQELSRLGLVEIGADGAIRLVSEAYLAKPGTLAALEAFEKNLAAHLDAATRNLITADAPPFMERGVHYNRLSEQSVRELQEMASRIAGEALLAINKAALARQTRDAEKPENSRRFSFGVYLHESEAKAPAPETPDETPDEET